MNKDKAYFIGVFKGNVEALETALASNTGGIVYIFPGYGLGVRVEGDKASACRMDQATVNPPRRHIVNGMGLKAILIDRGAALRDALKRAKQALANFETMDLGDSF
jgi:hypothetical protein